MRTVWELVKRAAVKWNADDCLTLGAALAYYTVFSLAPILVIVTAVAGAVFGPEAAQGEIVTQIRGLTGEEVATAIQSLIQSASRQGAGPRAIIIGLLVLLFGSNGWGWVPGIDHVLELADLLGSMLVHTLLFAMIFKLLPDVEIQWRDVWVGAAVTAGLFFVGKVVIGVYLGSSELGAAYGAASWVILILAWVYYSAQILLFGAEFTYAYATGTTSPRSRPPRA